MDKIKKSFPLTSGGCNPRIAASKFKEVNKVKRPDLFFFFSIWEFITAFFAFIGISAIAVFVIPDAIKPWWGLEVGTIFGLSIGILVLMCYIGIAIAGGMGLLKGKEWGRIMSIAHAALSLFYFPIGTVIGILSIIYLTRPEVLEYIKASSGEQ